MLTVENVMTMLVCSRASAYEDMNRALGRTQPPGRTRWNRQLRGIGAQGRNRTTDTGIFSPFEPVEKSQLPSGDVRQAPFKTRQGRYAEARSCTVPFTWFHLVQSDVLLVGRAAAVAPPRLGRLSRQLREMQAGVDVLLRLSLHHPRHRRFSCLSGRSRIAGKEELPRRRAPARAHAG